MRKPKDRHAKFKAEDKVLCCGQTALVVSDGWWDEYDDFRYELDFKWGKGDRRYKGLWTMKEENIEAKDED